MTTQSLLDRLEAVRSRGAGKWSGRCPAHQDRSPSLSIREGDQGHLLHCFAGCTPEQVCEALGFTVRDLFYDTRQDPHTVRETIARRDRERREKARNDAIAGFTIDALREADYFIRSRQGLDISTWTEGKLDHEVTTLADAYQLLECEEIDG